MKIALLIIPVALAYVLGSFPVGVLVARLVSGVEVREIGSGKTGATNVYRATGKVGAILTVLGDALKGIMALWIARVLTALLIGETACQWAPWIETLAGIAVVAGHNWSLFLKFRGGAGTVVTIGVLGTINPWATVALVVVALSALLISRTASIGSLTIAIAQGFVLLTFAVLGITPWAYVLFGFIGAAMTVHALRTNIWRILKKEERQLKTDY
ncbi:MAG: glycerol-3-phosphate acyltransferase [Anaerolineae bacterium]|nr:glycerol-3-phosphate acyltransferase [Anaerolineae bacterium]